MRSFHTLSLKGTHIQELRSIHSTDSRQECCCFDSIAYRLALQLTDADPPHRAAMLRGIITTMQGELSGNSRK